MKRWILSLALVCATSACADPEWVRGVITKIAPERAQVTLRHEAIPGVGMGAMTMPYKVLDPAVLHGFKPGDVVRFTVEVNGDQIRLESLEHAK